MLEYPNEKWLQHELDAALDAEFDPQPWHDLYFSAFDALRCDRLYGAMGGEGPIYYTALSRYAEDNDITGSDRWLFLIFMNAVDGEWLAMRAEEMKQQEAERKRNGHADQ